MAYKFLPFVVAAIIIGAGLHSDAAETAKKKAATAAKKPTTAAKKPVAAASKTTATAKKRAAKPSSSASKRAAISKRRSAKKAPPRPRGQQTPTPERHQEIQQALFERGYLKTQPTGTWGPDSAEALKRFQQDQKIDATGKLNSLSLIALGLGPKRNATALVRPNNDNRSTEGNKGP